MTFSICIPNYNYARYIGATIESVLAQEGADFEICVSDNASSDGSVDVVRGFNDPRIRVSVNATNLGFARNLDCAVAMATGDTVIVLSSDDLMAPGALRRYREILEAMGPEKAARAVIGSGAHVIDGTGVLTGTLDPADFVWGGTPATGGIRSSTGAETLGRCLRTFKTPFQFCTTAYPRALWNETGGYGSARSINPDKWFHWRILARPGVTAHYVDQPLFSYRWHRENQSAQQARSGALKFLADDYASSFQVTDEMLDVSGVTRAELERAFVALDIGKHGLGALGRESWMKALRTLHFGFACYPVRCLASAWWWVLAVLVALGPIGRLIAYLRARRSDSSAAERPE